MIKRIFTIMLTALGIFALGTSMALSQECPPEGPDIIVTGGYYPVQWNRPYPAVWQGTNPFYPTIDYYDPMPSWRSSPDSFIQVSTLQNPAASIKIGKNMLAHVAARHLYNSPGNGSKFSQKYSEPIHLLAMIAYAVTHSVPTASQSQPRALTYTTTIPDVIGNSYGGATSRVTVYVFNTGAYENGMPIYIVTNMHPGDRS